VMKTRVSGIPRTREGERERHAHNGPHPSLRLRRLAHPTADLVAQPPRAPIPRIAIPSLLRINLSHKPLQKRAVYSVLRHPVEVPPYRARVAAAKHLRGSSIFVREPFNRVELRGVVGGGIGPEIGVRAPVGRRGEGLVDPVQPAVVACGHGISISGGFSPGGRYDGDTHLRRWVGRLPRR
jgi:hypothetical protein